MVTCCMLPGRLAVVRDRSTITGETDAYHSDRFTRPV